MQVAAELAKVFALIMYQMPRGYRLSRGGGVFDANGRDMTVFSEAGPRNHVPLTRRAGRLAKPCLTLKQWEAQHRLAKCSNAGGICVGSLAFEIQ